MVNRGCLVKLHDSHFNITEVHIHSNNVVCYTYYAFMWDIRNELDCPRFMQSWELTSVPLGHCQCSEMDQELLLQAATRIKNMCFTY